MREERGNVIGDLMLYEAYTLLGTVKGNVSVLAGGKVYIRGTVIGNLIVEDGGRVHIWGTVQGDVVVNEGTKLIHSGVIGGDAINTGGRLFIESNAKVQGKVKTVSGETRDERPEALEE